MRITITGFIGEGKSTIATLIANALKDAGIKNVTVADEELIHSFYAPEKQNLRLASMATKGVPIVIETRTSARPTLRAEVL